MLNLHREETSNCARLDSTLVNPDTPEGYKSNLGGEVGLVPLSFPISEFSDPSGSLQALVPYCSC